MREQADLPRWRVPRRKPETIFHVRGDFISPEYRAYVVSQWEYHPGWGTTMPPPIKSERSTWHGVPTWSEAQELWCRLFDIDMFYVLSDVPSERTAQWQNLTKRYQTKAIAWAAADGDASALARRKAEADRSKQRRQDLESDEMSD